jgi:hypothetical protein
VRVTDAIKRTLPQDAPYPAGVAAAAPAADGAAEAGQVQAGGQE